MTLPLRALASIEGWDRRIVVPNTTLFANDIHKSSFVDAPPNALTGRSILILTKSQFAAALALLELDGVAHRLILCPDGLVASQIEHIIEAGQIDTIVTDSELGFRFAGKMPCFFIGGTRLPPTPACDRTETEWVLLTSGTTGMPKLVVHTLSTLMGAIKSVPGATPPIWGTFYDIRRYGGLQILLRALAGGGSLALGDKTESVEDYLQRAGALGITHISGTPSHWRCALMGGAAGAIGPQSVRLSGEIADQAILDKLREQYPGAALAHAFASTEAGVAFEVTDGRAGFPADYVGARDDGVEIRIVNDSLRIRSPRNALRILGSHVPIGDDEGFVDNGDIVECHGDRCFFAGRRDGTINVGGNKVHPEEVETAINAHPRVEMARARGRRNPILGAIIEADIVLRRDADPHDDVSDEKEIIAFCARVLPPHMTPSAIKIVPSLPLAPSGKVERHRA